MVNSPLFLLQRFVLAGILFLALISFLAVFSVANDISLEGGSEQGLFVQCTKCHIRLSDVLPEDHIAVGHVEGAESCLVCHSVNTSDAFSLEWMVHLKHYSMSEFSGDCYSCHERFNKRPSGKNIERTTPYFRSWATSNYLDRKHALKQVSCTLCHGIFFPDRRPSMERCLQCHGSYEQIAAFTKDVIPNPHASHFPDLRCTLCHMAHKQSELYCNQCHDYKLTVP